MAANPIQARGLELIQAVGSPIIQLATVPASDSTVLGKNDPVVITAIAADGRLTVARAAANGGIHGVIQNPKVFPWTYLDTDARRAASVLSTVSVLLTPPGTGHIFRIQASTDADFAVANFATTRFCNLDTVGDADSVTGISTVELTLAAPHATDGDMEVLGLDDTYGAQNTIAGIRVKLKARVSNT